MAKSTEKLPLQFYIQRSQGISPDQSGDDPSTSSNIALSNDVTSRLRSIYEALWSILSDFAAQFRTSATRELFAGKYFFDAQEITGHPNVFLRCQLVDDKWLALILEQAVQEPSFAGRAGLILGARGSGKSALLRQRHAYPTIELDLTGSPRLFHVHSSAFQSHADEFLARLVSNPSEVTHVLDWFEKTQKVVTVPEDSLRETTEWLRQINQEIAAERKASQAKAEEQNDAFMRMFASLAHSRLGA